MSPSGRTYAIEGLRKSFGRGSGAVTAIDSVDLQIAPGELVVLLGPSGCGKTTALRCIAGLESATAGVIRFGDRVVFDAKRRVDLPPDKRDIGMVFQSYALWPHKSVRQNIAYPLKVRGLTKGLKQEGWVEAAARLVDCGHLLDRYPGQLSGGQQQRVALARGIVARPDLILFDEPLSNLDALLRSQVRAELHELHRRLGFTGVYVTHDQAEAFAIGDRLAIMRAGRIEQIGTPEEIYASPVSEYAANFVGLTNRLTLHQDATGWRSAFEPGHDPIDVPAAPIADELHARFRPSAAYLRGDGDVSQGLRLRAVVVDSVYGGGRYEVTVTHGEVRFSAVAEPHVAKGLRAGDAVQMVVPWQECSWYAGSGSRLESQAVPQQTVA